MVDVFVIANRGQYNHRIYRTLKYLWVEAKRLKNSITPQEIEAEVGKCVVIGGGQ
jgi:GMP synthase (glutamine-hydrolysing)